MIGPCGNSWGLVELAGIEPATFIGGMTELKLREAELFSITPEVIVPDKKIQRRMYFFFLTGNFAGNTILPL